MYLGKTWKSRSGKPISLVSPNPKRKNYLFYGLHEDLATKADARY
jgi:hypothetical protein